MVTSRWTTGATSTWSSGAARVEAPSRQAAARRASASPASSGPRRGRPGADGALVIGPPLSFPRGPRRATPTSAEERAGNHHPLDLGRALADAAHPRLAVPALEGKLLGHAVPAVDLDRGVDHAPQHLARVELGDGEIGRA